VRCRTANQTGRKSPEGFAREDHRALFTTPVIFTFTPKDFIECDHRRVRAPVNCSRPGEFVVDRSSNQKKRQIRGMMAIPMHKGSAVFILLGLFASACSSPLTTREQGGLIGAGLGAGSGAIIGGTVGHAAVGALIGGPVGLIAGALIGDQLMGQERTQDQQQRQIDQNAAELERLRRENQRLREESPAPGY